RTENNPGGIGQSRNSRRQVLRESRPHRTQARRYRKEVNTWLSKTLSECFGFSSRSLRLFFATFAVKGFQVACVATASLKAGQAQQDGCVARFEPKRRLRNLIDRQLWIFET